MKADKTVVPASPLPEEVLRRARWRSLSVGLVGTMGCLLGVILSPAQFLASYLVAYFFWLSVALGALGILMLGHVASGAWTIVVRRPLEAASRTLPPLAALFIPVLLGLHKLYPWARPGAAIEEVVPSRAFYLEPWFFMVRALAYFIVWAWLAHRLSAMSARQDAEGGPEPAPVPTVDLGRRMRKLSAAGLVLYGLTMTFASVDWIMSLDPRWYSTIYGVYVMGGQAVLAMSFAILVALWIYRRSSPLPVLTRGHFHDFGKMLLAFVMVWAYFAFSQLLIVWSANLPEEIPYFVSRLGPGYKWVSLSLVILHFALPFLLLLSRDLKRDAPRLAAVAGLVFAMRWVDVYWLVAPSVHPQGLRLHWLDPVTFLAVGGVWLGLFFNQLGKRPLVPFGDPMLSEALHHG